MIGEDESLEKEPSPAARKSGHGRSDSVKTTNPKEATASEETAPIDESESTPAEETNGAQSESDPGEADRINEVIRLTVNLILRRYFRKIENGERETAESELSDLLERARDGFTCVPAPADTTAGPWMPLTANKGQEDEEFHWARPVYWLDRQVLEQLSVVVMGTQDWGEDSGEVYPQVLVTDPAHRPYTKDWWRLKAVTPAEAREVAAALAEAADKADEVEAALDDQKD